MPSIYFKDKTAVIKINNAITIYINIFAFTNVFICTVFYILHANSTFR